MATVEVRLADRRENNRRLCRASFADPAIHKIPNKYVNYFRRKNAALD
jgi:hypothetical protein